MKRGWLEGAMVLDKLPVPGRPSNLADSRARVCWLVGYSGLNGPLRRCCCCCIVVLRPR